MFAKQDIRRRINICRHPTGFSFDYATFECWHQGTILRQPPHCRLCQHSVFRRHSQRAISTQLIRSLYFKIYTIDAGVTVLMVIITAVRGIINQLATRGLPSSSSTVIDRKTIMIFGRWRSTNWLLNRSPVGSSWSMRNQTDSKHSYLHKASTMI